ncbi:hypothetical protein [Flavobacterium caeni]|uniref:Uncharacterized protein n=1 Tax=Flavobacterium caeni TaxID=490189 RepID=A0A1G5KCD7_9FLAO|nr:hypothetical protein [Flavobacterium caeni]SCY97718.1 hypothetical protein SAMN02927903_03208 [Flavobacterium caeni]
MKKLSVILFSAILLSVVWLYFSGLEKRYSYENTGKQNIELLENPNFKIQLSATPNDSALSVEIVFNKLNKTIIIDSASVEVFENQKLKLIEVSATDGFYNWVEEKNGKAETFNKLPEHLKIVHDSIEAYFNYSWNFEMKKIKLRNIKIKISMSLNVENKRMQLNKVVNMELFEKKVFVSPIRFH